MKAMRKIQAIMLAIVIAVCSFSVTAFAEEATPSEVKVTQVISADGNGTVVMPTSINQTFNFTGYHRGADRSYSNSNLFFYIKVTDSNGTTPGDRIAVVLHDYNNNTQIFTAYADGTWYGYNLISVIPGKLYYFTYENLTSSTRSMTVTMQIN